MAESCQHSRALSARPPVSLHGLQHERATRRVHVRAVEEDAACLLRELEDRPVSRALSCAAS